MLERRLYQDVKTTLLNKLVISLLEDNLDIKKINQSFEEMISYHLEP